MFLRPIIDVNEIRKAYSMFEKNMISGTKKITTQIGWQGGGTEADLFWNENLKIWSHFSPDEAENRYWCIFGVDSPEIVKMPNIICEINMPYEGAGRRTAATFAEDDNKQIYLIHTGRIGGGRKGIGMKAFLSEYQPNQKVNIAWNDGHWTTCIQLGALDDPIFSKNVAEFIHAVAKFKESFSPHRIRRPYKPRYQALDKEEFEKAYIKALDALQLCLKKAKGFGTGADNITNTVTGAHQDEVLSKYGPMFSPKNISKLPADEFRGFLRIENNHHWTQLHRSGDRACNNMEALRKGLSLLVDESKPIELRLTEVISNTRFIETGIATPILMIVYPDKYGVWNHRSKRVLKILRIWPSFPRKSSKGEKYVIVNALLKKLRDDLNTDFWTLDGLFWYYDEYYYPGRGNAERAGVE
jgi:hypothetical protein